MVAISVIVPARNAQPTLGACLAALRQEGVPGAQAELFVVDDASTDETARIAAHWGAHVLHADGRGPAAARNLGARAAHGQIFVFLDADTAPRPGWLAELVAPFDDPCVVAVKGRYHTRQRSLVARFSQVEFEEKYARLERARQIDFVDTGTAAFRRSAFLEAGGFDERFTRPSAEDVELAYRLASRGARFVFAPEAGVDHRHADRLDQYLFRKARFGFFRLQVYRRFPSKALGDAYTPPLMGVQIALAGLVGMLGLLAVARGPGAGRGLAVALSAFACTTVPLTRRAAAQDGLLLAALAPGLSFARAFAQGLGVLAAVLAGVAERLGQLAPA
jgi:cellulose synthase/poly-beta-1,6-N-acetylglucosamine synthase-like glycosyltransferase